jgi:hypothetical protein
MALADDLAQAFYAWELRGRGWHGANASVMLEPAFRRCDLALPGTYERPAEPYDDGRRPTVLSALIDRWRGQPKTTLPAVREALPVEEEHPSLPAPESGPLTAFRLDVPEGFSARADVGARLLGALSATVQPLCFEFVGHGGQVTAQIVCREDDQEHVAGSFEGYAPEVALNEEDDRLGAVWDDEAESFLVDFGLSEEFFLPLQTFPSLGTDPYIPLVAALAATREDECLAVQMLFERVRNPWSRAILEAVGGPDQSGIFLDAPHFLPLAREKTATPLFAMAFRIAAQAKDQSRARQLARSLQAFVLQFGRPGANSLIPLDNHGYLEGWHEAAFLARESCRTGMILSASELLGFVHVPDASVRQAAFVRETTRTKAAPLVGGHAMFRLGENRHRGSEATVRLSTEERLQHTHIIGASGTGKSTLLIQGILQDITAGNGVVVLDPHGDLIDEVVARLPQSREQDVILFDPADEDWPISINILSAQSELERQLLASDLVGIFQRLSTSWGDTMGTLLGNAILAILESEGGGTLVDLRRFLTDDGARRALLATVADEEVRHFWEKSFPLIGARSIGPILARLDAFLRPKLIRRVVGNRERSLDFDAIMAGQHVFLGKLSQGLIGEENASLLGSLLVTKFHQLALARQRLAKGDRHPCFLYVDEFQHFVTPSMASLLTEGRKYGLGLVLAHQNLRQIQGSPVESALLGNAYSRVIFRVGDDDARKLSTGLGFFEARDLQNLGRGEAIARFGSAANDCNLATIALSPVAVGDAAVRHDAIREASRQRFATAFVKPERLGETEEVGSSAPAAEVPSAHELPIAGVATVPTVAHRPLPSPDDSPRPEREHIYLQHLIARLGEERGFRAIMEEAVGEGRVDVALRREQLAIACEVSITTGADHELENIRKCLTGAYSHIVMIVPHARKRAAIAKRVSERFPESPVAVLGVDEIVTYLDQFALCRTDEQVVRGYKVRINRQAISPSEEMVSRAKIARVISRSIRKSEDD